ncbi:MAG: hypothetical protein IJD84_09335 [Parabacteroides sp.]|nr:hypothetical protein [Parabacteroides sp.]
MNNILVSALGLNPDIIEEVLGVTNYSETKDFYSNYDCFNQVKEIRDRMNFSIYQADELWLIATDKQSKTINNRRINSTLEDFSFICNHCSAYVKKIRLFILDGVEDITRGEEADWFHDLTLRVITFAKQLLNGGKLYLSLACGRKTMSTDMQDAAYCFGCDALLHVLGDKKEEATPVFLGAVSANEALSPSLQFFEDKEIVRVKPNKEFLIQIQEQKKRSQYFFTTYYLKENETRSNFHVLYTLPPSKIELLKEIKIGYCKENYESDMEFIRLLPKTDLHCHLGGVLSPEEMIEVAKCYEPLIKKECSYNKLFSQWVENLNGINGSVIRPENWKEWYKSNSEEMNVHKSLVVSSFLLSFSNRLDELSQLIWGEYNNELTFSGIEIQPYEALGDLQGSGLLCNEQAIRKTVCILLEKCKHSHVDYVEIRCSPLNYEYDSLTGEQILTAIFEELEKETQIKSSVILIASRHGDEQKIDKSIELAKKLKDDFLFKKYFRGFDLAGDERAKSPSLLRDKFIKIMQDCLNITIHAGETMPCENIWEAVYYLNAERIGHGLTLIQKEDLMEKFLDRGIGIEMCPSSNFQIVGYKDNYYKEETKRFKDYPLKIYLDRELKVNINTDNPGISRTDMNEEYLKAARLTPGGLSKWELLQLSCNGFRSAFYPYKEKKELIRKVENYLGSLIKKGYL